MGYELGGLAGIYCSHLFYSDLYLLLIKFTDLLLLLTCNIHYINGTGPNQRSVALICILFTIFLYFSLSYSLGGEWIIFC